MPSPRLRRVDKPLVLYPTRVEAARGGSAWRQRMDHGGSAWRVWPHETIENLLNKSLLLENDNHLWGEPKL